MNLSDLPDMVAAGTALALFNGLWPGLVLVGLVWSINSFLTHKRLLNATTRFAISATALVVCVGFMVGQWGRTSMVSPPGAEPGPLVETATISLDLQDPFVLAPVNSSQTPPSQITLPSMDTGRADLSQENVEPVWVDEPEPKTDESTESGSTLLTWFSVQRFTLPGSTRFWLNGLFLCWLLIASTLVMRVACGLWAVRRLKLQSLAIPDSYQTRVNTWVRRLNHPRRVRIAGSTVLDTPVAVGFFRPMILIPMPMMDALNDEEIGHVLLHELAHLQRWDDWTILVQQCIAALLFFHPGVQWLCRTMNHEREFACDDWVVALTGRPKSYAACLAKMVALHINPRQYVAAPGFAAGKKRLFERVSVILDKSRRVSFQLSGLVYGSVLIVTAILLTGMISITPVVALAELEEPPAISFDVSQPAYIEILSGESMPLQPVDNGTENVPALQPLQQTAIEIDAPGEDQPDVLSTDHTEPRLLNADIASPVLAVPTAPKPDSKGSTEVTSDPEQQAPLSKQSLIKVLKAARKINSSGDKASFLINALDRLIEDDDVYVAFIETAATIQSSGDRSRVLTGLLKSHKLGTTAALKFLDTAASVTSSNDKARILLQAATSLSQNEEVEDAFLKTAETVRSASEYRRVLSAYLNGKQESEEQ